MDVTLQYFESCPNWKITDQRLKDVIASGELEVAVRYQLVESPEEAERYGFHGSPSILIDGVDPFATDHTEVGYACRTYIDESGRPTDAPSVEQIADALGV
jgi:hypothetical protein